MYDFIDYISWVYADQEPDSIFQFIRKQSLEDIEYSSDVIYGFEFQEFYYDRLFNIRPFSHSTYFLDYHYEKYTENKLDFLTFAKWSLSIMETLKLESIERINKVSQTPLIKDLILEWIEKKKKELENESQTSKKRTSPKLNEYNKPVLNQVQISILFRIMKDLNIISNRDLPKTTYSEIIQTLTGYSENPLRTNFSASQLIEISDRPQDYQEIIDMLIKIIRKIEKAKNEISKSD